MQLCSKFTSPKHFSHKILKRLKNLFSKPWRGFNFLRPKCQNVAEFTFSEICVIFFFYFHVFWPASRSAGRASENKILFWFWVEACAAWRFYKFRFYYRIEFLKVIFFLRIHMNCISNILVNISKMPIETIFDCETLFTFIAIDIFFFVNSTIVRIQMTSINERLFTYFALKFFGICSWVV